MKKLLLIVVSLISSSFGFSQTNPTAQSLPFSQDFSGFTGTTTTYPAGFQGWTITGSTSTSYPSAAPNANQALTSGTNASSSGGIFDMNGKIGMLSTGSALKAISVSIETTGQNSILVQWTAATQRQETGARIGAIGLQYRVGTSGTFTTVSGSDYQNPGGNTTTGTGSTNPQDLSVTLPPACDNQSVVQLRWVYKEVSGSGNRPSFSIDNISVTSTPATPSVDLSVSANTGSEVDATEITVTLTASAPAEGSQTVDLSVTGTGITAGDYSLGSSQITIADGETVGTTTFTIINDSETEGTETATLTISNPSSGLIIGTTTTQNITIADDDANTVELSADLNSGSESGLTIITLTATAKSIVAGNQTLDLSVTGTGIAGSDYSLSANQITILNGSKTGTVTFTVQEDSDIEGTETANISITNPSSGIAIGLTSSQNIEITDNDFATTIQFSTTSETVSEGAGTTTLTLTISNPSTETATTVDVGLTGGTGSSNDVNLYSTQTVTFPANSVSDQTVTLTLTNDELVEGTETILFSLQNISGGNSAILGVNQLFTLTVSDNDVNAVSLNTIEVAHTQDFNTLAQTGTNAILPAGWMFSETGTGANSTFAADSGFSNSGNTYSYGRSNSSDRAFGTLLSGSVTSTIGAYIYNNTGATINKLQISYIGEQWRLGTTGRNDSLNFQYSTDATSLTTGTWININDLDLISPVTTGTAGALNGNLPSNQILKSFELDGLEILNGNGFYIRLLDFNASGADDGLAIDDFSIRPFSASVPVELSAFTVSASGKNALLKWETTTETNNAGFEIQKSEGRIQKAEWKSLGFVAGKGTTTEKQVYSFTDKNVLGSVSYRLKQIDADGTTNLSQVLSFIGTPASFEVSGNYPNPFNPSTLIKFTLPEASSVVVKVHNIIGQEIITLVNGKMDAGVKAISFDAKGLSSGVYFYSISANGKTVTRSMTLMK